MADGIISLVKRIYEIKIMKDSAAVSIFPGMASMYWSDWSWGWKNRFYSIGDILLV